MDTLGVSGQVEEKKMTAPVRRLKKIEIIWLATHRCKHRKPYLEHYNCFLKENPVTYPFMERIGFFDIEIYGNNFNAPFGIVLTYCLKEMDGKIYKRTVTCDELYTRKFDKPLLTQMIKDMENFDRIITHYGGDRRFDVPYCRSRAVKFKLPFPEYKMLYLSDTFPILKNKFKLGSNRLGSACDFLGIESKEHPINYDVWQMIITGNKRLMKGAIKYILQHNIEDVESLEKLWKRIYRYAPLTKTSI